METRTYQCIGCRARSPDVATEYTLISSRFGWRLTRKKNADGSYALEWRCPTCWARFKDERGEKMSPFGMATAPPPSSRKPKA
jgi:DNA-directed RNA polymerase subunit RPC12/RpoP